MRVGPARPRTAPLVNRPGAAEVPAAVPSVARAGTDQLQVGRARAGGLAPSASLPQPPVGPAPAPALETLKALTAQGGVDAGQTWGDWQNPHASEFNFGHKAVDGELWRKDDQGRLVWADNGKTVSWEQVNLMPEPQRLRFFAEMGVQPAPAREVVAANPALRAAPAGWVAGKGWAPGQSPEEVKAATAAAVGPVSGDAARQMEAIANLAEQTNGGKRPRGRCYEAVYKLIERSGFGKMPATGVPDSHSAYARNFAEYANVPGNLERLGLRKLEVTNPYDAPRGAIVVVGPGTPGTSHPTAGDIAVSLGGGRFINDGEMGYGGAGSFPPGNRQVLGVYVPA